ncbi:MAG: cysteine-rich small domain-containing protein [Clostridia bacterium]|nr:cysteine-rich small domain-containing protein [Clostridia bacterium]
MTKTEKRCAFFQNRACEFFPCHDAVDPERFNCLFCYCPLYALGRRCGGDFRYNAKGLKDCSRCSIPHIPENYARILSRYDEIAALVRTVDAQAESTPILTDGIVK